MVRLDWNKSPVPVHLLSPAALAIADTQGKWKPVPHLQMINQKLVSAWATPNSRTSIVVPFQHGKSVISSVYFPSWVLLLWPETRVGLGSYEEAFASGFGGKVRDVVNRFGPGLDPPRMIRTDTSAKGEWVIDQFGGGMICKGRGGALVGRPLDLLILDDLIKNAEEAQSPTVLDNIWDWYCTVAYSRLGPKAPVIGVGTRWGPKDLFGRWEAEAKVGGDKFDTILLKAIAEGSKDPLGRQPGEALWPERVPLARLQKIALNRPRWFKTCWQGEPEESQGLHFQPREWQRYTDVGDAWRVRIGARWNNYRKVDCTVVLALDWAQKGKRDSDRTAFVVAAMTPDGLTLVLAVYNGRLRYEENAPTLAEWCRRWEPEGGDRIIVVGEDDMLSDAMTVECRRYRDIPEIRRIAIKGKGKLVRAQAAIIRSQNGRFLLPATNEPWYEEMCDQLTSFSGAEGAEDDIADCFGILGRIADEFSPGEDMDDDEPTLGAEGYRGYVYGE